MINDPGIVSVSLSLFSVNCLMFVFMLLLPPHKSKKVFGLVCLLVYSIQYTACDVKVLQLTTVVGGVSCFS